MEMKQCPNCGKQIPAEASLCPACMTELTERTVVPQPKQRPKWWLLPAGIGAAIVVLLLAIAVALLFPSGEQAEPSASVSPPAGEENGQDTPVEQQEAQVFDNGTNYLIYTIDGETFQVAAHFDYYVKGTPVPGGDTKALSIIEGEGIGTMSFLSVWQGAEYSDTARQTFMERVESVSVSLTDLEGSNVAAVNYYGEHGDTENTTYDASLYLGSGGKSQVCWTVIMDNGDTLRLYGYVEVEEQKIFYAAITSEEAPDMDSLCQHLSELCEQADGAPMEITLPAVCYEGNLSISNLEMRLNGTEEDGQHTTFSGPISIQEESLHLVYFRNIHFTGSGGTGIDCSGSAILQNCTFSGYDVAVDWQDHGWVVLQDCTLRDNEVAVRVNSRQYQYADTIYYNNTFENNGTAWLIQALGRENILDLAGSRFTGNQTDIDNPAGAVLDTSGAIFK